MNNVEEIVGKVLSEIGGLKIDIAKMVEQLKHMQEMNIERFTNQQNKIDELSRRVDKTDANFRWIALLIIGYFVTQLLGLVGG